MDHITLLQGLALIQSPVVLETAGDGETEIY